MSKPGALVAPHQKHRSGSRSAIAWVLQVVVRAGAVLPALRQSAEITPRAYCFYSRRFIQRRSVRNIRSWLAVTRPDRCPIPAMHDRGSLSLRVRSRFGQRLPYRAAQDHLSSRYVAIMDHAAAIAGPRPDGQGELA